MKKKKLFLRVISIITILTFIMASSTIQINAANLPNSLYKEIKGYWTSASSAGNNYKVTKNSFKVYDRETGRCIGINKVKSVKKTERGYFIKLKRGSRRFGYLYNEEADMLESYSAWSPDPNTYSGSSSLMRGKW